MRFNFFSQFFAGSSVSQGFCYWHLLFFRWFKRCYVQSLWTLWIGQTQWPVPSGPTTLDGRTPYEDRCGTRGWKIPFMFLAYAYLHRLLICIGSISIHIAHCFFFKSTRYIYSTRIRCKLIWIASRLHSRLYSLSRLFSKSVFPCFRTGQIRIWDQVTMRLLERLSLTKFRWAQLFVGATLYGEDFGHGTIATRGCIPSWTDPRRTTTTIKSSFRPSRTT